MLSPETVRWIIGLSAAAGLSLLLALIGAVWRLGSNTGGLRSEIAALRLSVDLFKATIEKLDKRVNDHEDHDDYRFALIERGLSKIRERLAAIEAVESSGSLPRLPLTDSDPDPEQ
jgi:hypothetical protein